MLVVVGVGDVQQSMTVLCCGWFLSLSMSVEGGSFLYLHRSSLQSKPHIRLLHYLFLPASLKENLFGKTSKTVSLEIDSSLQTNVPPEPLLGETRGLRLQGAGDTPATTFEVFLLIESNQVAGTEVTSIRYFLENVIEI